MARSVGVLVFAFFPLFLVGCGSPQTDSHAAFTGDTRGGSFPVGPAMDITPGSMCTCPDSYRYPEHIPYCTRNVSSSTKAQVIQTYDRSFGYQIEAMNRQDFKIDHFIPLCMGGSNSSNNLWPQHKTVYEITDSIEQKLCELMAAGRFTQADSMALMRRVKTDLSQAAAVHQRIDQ